MNAITSHDDFAPAPTNGPHGRGASVFTSRKQAAFLESLAQFGNVRLACRAACVSAQTAYRSRRSSSAFAQVWDAALLTARTHAEAVLADRAVNGWEESVFYHGEEVARRRRYSDRLLLAHLARLDRLAERAALQAQAHDLEATIAALRDGDTLADVICEGGTGAGAFSAQECVPPVPACRACEAERNAARAADVARDRARRIAAMHAARPAEARGLYLSEVGEEIQLDAFEAGVPEWWAVTSEDALDAALAALD